MAPVINFISPRTTFFAVIFLFIGFAAMTYPSPMMDVNQFGEPNTVTDQGQIERRNFALRTLVLMILPCLVLVKSVAGLISNSAIVAEFAGRIKIVEEEKLASENIDSTPIRVPFIATQPVALSYIQSPEYDREFLANWGRLIGRPIVHVVSESAPLPKSFTPLKAIKYRHRVSQSLLESTHK